MRPTSDALAAFVPADGGPKLDKALASGADGVIVDLEDSIAPERKEAARKRGRLPQGNAAKQQRPRLLVRINGLATGLTDADLDAVVPGKPDAILLPKAEGGATVTHTDAKLAAREAIAGLPEGRSRSWRRRWRRPRACSRRQLSQVAARG